MRKPRTRTVAFVCLTALGAGACESGRAPSTAAESTPTRVVPATTPPRETASAPAPEARTDNVRKELAAPPPEPKAEPPLAAAKPPAGQPHAGIAAGKRAAAGPSGVMNAFSGRGDRRSVDETSTEDYEHHEVNKMT